MAEETPLPPPEPDKASSTPPPADAGAAPPPVERPAPTANAGEEYIIEHAKFNRGAIAFLDILGTKGIHSEKHLRDELRARRKLILDLGAGTMSRAWQPLINMLFRWGGKSDSESRERRVVREVLAFSDSIVLTMERPASPEGLIGLLCDELSRIVLKALKDGILLRGAVSYGEFFLDSDSTVLLGPAAVDAHEWSEMAEWVGVLLTPTAYYAWSASSERSSFESTVREFDVPLKDQKSVRTGAVDWAKDARGSKEELARLRTEVMRAFSLRPISQRDQPKYSNTLLFLSDSA